MQNPMFIPSKLEKPRRRLIRRYRRLGSYQRLATDCGVNVRYVYDFINRGIIPVNKTIQRRLGIRPPRPITINQLLQRPLQDQPPQILRLALMYRKEMQP